jgi:hypothetical protein
MTKFLQSGRRRDVCALLAGERRLHDHHAWLTEQLRSADDEGSA